MRHSPPLVICDENEAVRLLLKSMLTKHGFFHLIEVQNQAELLPWLKNDEFILIHKNLLNEELKQRLTQRKNFLIISQADDPETIDLAAFFGVKHFISFPYSSKSLVEKINSLIN